MERIERLWELGYISAVYPIEYAASSEDFSESLSEAFESSSAEILAAIGISEDRQETINQLIEHRHFEEAFQYLCDIGENGCIIEFHGRVYTKNGKDAWYSSGFSVIRYLYAKDWADIPAVLIKALPELESATHRE